MPSASGNCSEHRAQRAENYDIDEDQKKEVAPYAPCTSEEYFTAPEEPGTSSDFEDSPVHTETKSTPLQAIVEVQKTSPPKFLLLGQFLGPWQSVKVELGIQAVTPDFTCCNHDAGPSKKREKDFGRSTSKKRHKRHIVTRETYVKREPKSEEKQISNQENFSSGDELGSAFSEEFNLDATEKAFTDALAAVGSMAENLYLLSLWFGRQKFFKGNQISILMSDKEVDLQHAIMARSHAKSIAQQFQPAKFVQLSRRAQDSLKACLKNTLRTELAESKARLQQLYREMDLLVTDSLPKARRDVQQAIEQATEHVEKDSDDILCEMAHLEQPASSERFSSRMVMKDIVGHIANLERHCVPTDIDVQNMVKAIVHDILNHEGQNLPRDELGLEDSDLNTSDDEIWPGRPPYELVGMFPHRYSAGFKKPAEGTFLLSFVEMIIDINLMRQWFSRDKIFIRNRMLIALTHREANLFSVIFRITHMFILGRLTCGARQLVAERVKRNQIENERLGKWGLGNKQRVVEEMIVKALPVAKREAELAVERITEALERAVNAIPCRKSKSNDRALQYLS